MAWCRPPDPSPARSLPINAHRATLALALAAACSWSADALAQATTAGSQAVTDRSPPAAAIDRAARDGLLVRAEQARAQEHWTEALSIYNHLLDADPRDDVAYRMRALTLADLGASARADELLDAWPQDFADYQRDRIRGDAVARMIGWGKTYPVEERARDAEMLRAQAALRELQAQPDRTNWETLRLRMDSLVSTNALRQYDATIREYEALRREQPELPGYVHAAAGEAYLSLRRPGDAEGPLRQAIALDPGDIDAKVLLAYAQSEQEHFAPALGSLRELSRTQPVWPTQPGARAPYENWDRYKADLNLALMTSYAQDLATAEAMLDRMVRVGPAHSGTQAALGGVVQRRGRPAEALERYDIALTLDPRNRDAAIGRAGALMDLQRVDEARAQQQALHAIYDNDRQVRELDADMAVRLGPQGRIGWLYGRSDADSGVSPLGTRERLLEVEAWTPLLGNRWRLGVLGAEHRAEFEPDTVRDRRAGAAVDYRHADFGARLAVYATSGDSSGGAWTLDGAWRLGDRWSATASLAANDADTPLQARRAGIDADSVAVGLAWAPNESRALDLGLRHMRFSDGNAHDQFSASLRQRLHASPHLLVDGVATVYATRADESDVPYFSPERSASATLGLRLDHILWRRYERHLVQRLAVDAGPSWQKGYGTHWVPSIAYRHEWRPARGHTLDYGVSWSRPVYDGNRERRWVFEASYRWGF